MDITRSLFCDVNDQIRHLAETYGLDRNRPVGFLCECDDPLCADTVPLGLEQFDVARRAGAGVIARGHGRLGPIGSPRAA